MKKAIEYLLIFGSYIAISTFTLHFVEPYSDFNWFVGILLGLYFASLLLLKLFPWKFKIGIGLFVSIFALACTTFINFKLFDPYSMDSPSRDYRIVFVMIAPKNKYGEPNIKLIEQISFFIIAFVSLVIMVEILKKIILKLNKPTESLN